MGAYINPPNETKDEFLQREGTRIFYADAFAHEDFTDKLLVVLVNNGSFTAAAIAFDAKEKEAFLSPDDPRICKTYVVERSKLYPVSSLQEYLPANT